MSQDLPPKDVTPAKPAIQPEAELDPIAIQEAKELEAYESSEVEREAGIDAVSERHRRFARTWFCGSPEHGIEPMNATKAYMHVYGPSHFARMGKELSHDVASAAGSELLRHSRVIGELRTLKAAENAIGELSGESIRKEIAYLAHSDLTELLDEDGMITAKGLKSLPKHVRRAIASIEEVRIPTRAGEIIKYKVKFHGKTQALDLATKVEKMVGSNTQINNGVVINIHGDD